MNAPPEKSRAGLGREGGEHSDGLRIAKAKLGDGNDLFCAWLD
jgi:hypothetical protein